MDMRSMTNVERFDSCGSDITSYRSVFKDYTSLPCCSSCGDDSPISENSWGCISSDPLTPPLSPNVEFPVPQSPNVELQAPISPNIELPAIDTFTSSFLTNPSTSAVDEFLNNNFAHDIPPELPDLRDTCNEIFDQEAVHVGATSRKVFSQSSSKDCMWNGRGFRSNLRTRRQSRSASPGSPSCSPVSGCVDPRYVFSQFNDRRKSSSPRRFKPTNRPETPSDSEEEVDVVTVEKSSPRIMRHPATLGVLCDDGKVFGTLVQKKSGKQPQLALVTTGSKRLETKSAYQPPRGRSPFKTKTPPAMSMVISGSSGTKTLNVQLKCVPVLNSNSSQVSVKRKMSASNDQTPGTVVHLMRLTPTSPTSSAYTESPEEDDHTGRKRRILSLEGVSMVSSTGINRLKKETATASKVVKNEPLQFKTAAFPMQTSKLEKFGLMTTEKRKPAKKTTKKPVITTPYETPTNSPESSIGDAAPTSPKKRTSGSRSSGSEEDSIRAAHNVLERQRREGLRNLYHDLRLVVPEVSDLEKAPKVCILTKAKEHVLSLRNTATELQTQKIIEQEKQKLLKQRLREMAAELTSVGPTPIRNSFIVKREFPVNNEQFAVFVN